MSELLLDRAGRRRSPATMPGFHIGRPPLTVPRRRPRTDPADQTRWTPASWTEERIGSGIPGVVTPGNGTGSFDMTTAPDALGYFVGDYAGLDFAGGALRPGFKPVHVRANSGNLANRTDVFATTASTSGP